MVGRPEMSTSCSFGMMAHLDRVGLTDSPCAGILVGEKGTKAKNVSGHLATNCGEEIHPRWFEKTAFEYITLRLQDNYVNQSYKKLKWKFLNIHSGEATFWFAWPLDFCSRLHELDLKLWPAMPQQPRCWSSRSRKIGALEFGMRLWRRVRPVQLHDFLLGQSMVARLGETSNTFSCFTSNYLGFHDSQFDLGICFIHGLVQRNQPPLLTWGFAWFPNLTF